MKHFNFFRIFADGEPTANTTVKHLSLSSLPYEGKVGIGSSSLFQNLRTFWTSAAFRVASLLCVLILGLGNVWGANSFEMNGFEDNTWTSPGTSSSTKVVASIIENQTRTGKFCLEISNTKGAKVYAKLASIAGGGDSKKTVHLIAWAKGGGSSYQAALSASGSNLASWTTLSTTSYTRLVATYGGSTSDREGRLYVNNIGSTYFDDCIFYCSSSATTDLTAPSSATGLAATTSQISWKEGDDTGDGATGIQATLVFYNTTPNATGLTLNNQGIYSLTSTLGPNKDQSEKWTLLKEDIVSVGKGNTQSYSGSGTLNSGTYAIVHRDLAYNYSTPAYVTLSSTPPTPATYSITYECDGATSGCPDPSTVSGQTALPTPLPTVAKTGYTFDGWFTNSDKTTPAVAGAALTDNITLYVKWTQDSPTPAGNTAEWGYGTSNLLPSNETKTVDGITLTSNIVTETPDVEMFTGGGKYANALILGHKGAGSAEILDITLPDGTDDVISEIAISMTINHWESNHPVMTIQYCSSSTFSASNVLGSDVIVGNNDNESRPDPWSPTIPDGTKSARIHSDGWNYSRSIYYLKVTATSGSPTPTSTAVTINVENGVNGALTASSEGLNVTTQPQPKAHYYIEGVYTTDALATKVMTCNPNGSNLALVAGINGFTDTDGKWICSDATKTLYAKQLGNQYTINYKDQGDATYSGSNINDLPKKHTYGQTTTLVDGVKEGYTFDGWYIEAACTNRKTELGSTDVTADGYTLYAKWTQDVVKYATSIDFEAGAKANPQPDITTFCSASNMTIAGLGSNSEWDKGSKTGYVGYKLKDNGATLSFTLQSGKTMLVTFGSCENLTMTIDGVVQTLSIAKGDSQSSTFPTDGTPYTATKDVEVVFTKGSSGTATMKAITIADPTSTYNITYKQNDPAVITDLKFASDFPSDEIGVTSPYTMKTAPDRVVSDHPDEIIYTFTGWNTAANGLGDSYDATKSYTLTDNLELYAQWKATEYDVIYYAEKDNTCTTKIEGLSPSKYTYEGLTLPASIPAEKCKPGYNFAGWWKYSSSSGTWTKKEGTLITYYGTFKAYASWTPIEYTIHYDNLNGTTKADETYTIESDDITLTAPTGTYAGYTFDGWYDGEGGTDNKVETIPQGSTGNKHLYAKWTEITLSSIEVKTAPTKTTYTAGEDFDPAGLVITKTMSDGSTSDVAYADDPDNFSFDPSTSLVAGTTSVTITYGGKSTTQAITVTAAPQPTPASGPTIANMQAEYNETTKAVDFSWLNYNKVDMSNYVPTNQGATYADGILTVPYSTNGWGSHSNFAVNYDGIANTTGIVYEIKSDAANNAQLVMTTWSGDTRYYSNINNPSMSACANDWTWFTMTPNQPSALPSGTTTQSADFYFENDPTYGTLAGSLSFRSIGVLTSTDQTIIVRKEGTTAPTGPTDGTQVYSGNASSCADNTVVAGKTYTYAVYAYNNSTYSTAVTKTITVKSSEEVCGELMSITLTGTTTADMSGDYASSCGISVSKNPVENGYKLGSNGNYIELTLKNTTFQEGDDITVNVTQTNDFSQWQLYDTKAGGTNIANIDVTGVVGDNTFTLPSYNNYGSTIALYRASSKMNPHVKSVTVNRPCGTRYTIHFAAGTGASGTMADVKIVENTEYTLPACTFTAPAGKEFAAWTSTDVEIADGKFTMPSKDVTLTATWRDPIPAVTADFAAGAGGSVDVATFLKNNHYTITAGGDVTWDNNSNLADKGLKIKTANHTISFWVQAGKKVTITMGTLEGTNNGTADLSTDGGRTYTEDALAGAVTKGGSTTKDNGPYTTTALTHFVIKFTSASYNILNKITIEDAAPATYDITPQAGEGGSVGTSGTITGLTGTTTLVASGTNLYLGTIGSANYISSSANTNYELDYWMVGSTKVEIGDNTTISATTTVKAIFVSTAPVPTAAEWGYNGSTTPIRLFPSATKDTYYSDVSIETNVATRSLCHASSMCSTYGAKIAQTSSNEHLDIFLADGKVFAQIQYSKSETNAAVIEFCSSATYDANNICGTISLNGNGTSSAQQIYTIQSSDIPQGAKMARMRPTTASANSDIYYLKVETAQLYNITKIPATNGDFTISAEQAIASTEITLTATPDADYQLGSWSVYKTGEPDTKVTVIDNKFTMPAYAVTVAANFTLRPDPYTGDLYPVGEAFAWEAWTFNEKMTTSTEGIYTWTGQINPSVTDNPGFKFCGNSSWWPQVSPSSNTSIPAGGGEFDVKVYESGSIGDGAKFTVEQSGVYTIIIDLTNKNHGKLTIFLATNTFEKDGDWSTATNWFTGALPTKEQDVIIAANATVNNTEAVAKNIVINAGKKITIQPTAALVVEGTIQSGADYNSDLSATTADQILIQSSASGTGALIFNNENGDTKATVQMYSKAYVDRTKAEAVWNWQYIGTPYNDVNDVQDNYYGTYLYSWSNAKQTWVTMKNGDRMQPFLGHCFTQDAIGAITMTGTLTSTDNYEANIVSGYNVLANSWTAPINIDQFTEADFGDISPKTIYLFNTGSDINGKGDVGDNTTDAGTYLSIPYKSSSYLVQKVIPSMQGFYVVSSADTKLTLKYDQLCRTNEVDIKPMRAPGRASTINEAEPVVLKLRVAGSRYHNNVYLLERNDFSTNFDDGWDGEFWDGESYTPCLYANTEAGEQAVAAIPQMDGTTIGFAAGEDNQYTFSFEYNDIVPLYLFDSQTNIYTPITNNSTYTFYTSDKARHNRFLITSYSGQDMPTGGDKVSADKDGAKKVILNEKLFIIHQHRLFDGQGKLVK